MRWRSRCESKRAGATENQVRVVGVERVAVPAGYFDAVHTLTQVKADGVFTGSGVREDWRRRSDGLLLRRVDRIEGVYEGDPDSDYDESYSIRLRSTQPDR